MEYPAEAGELLVGDSMAARRDVSEVTGRRSLSSGGVSCGEGTEGCKRLVSKQ